MAYVNLNKCNFTPDYMNIVKAAENIEVKRLPLYEHVMCDEMVDRVTGEHITGMMKATGSDQDYYFRTYCGFFRDMGYDAVPFELCSGVVFPGSGALGGHIKGAITCREDFEKYPWDGIEDTFFDKLGYIYEGLRNNMPEGMKAIGGVGNGVFEIVQDIVGYTDLCYILYDDPELFKELFKKVGDISVRIWDRFLREYGDIFCVCRFGDDLGYKDSTLIGADEIRENIIPVYKRIISTVHSYGKPFLLHSCGNIFSVMDDIIGAGINAKHSNEDQIAVFPEWVKRYGDRIGNFGGIDTDVLCRFDEQYIRDYILNVIPQCVGHGGFAFGSGNSIPAYVPTEGYLAMVDTVRRYRGDYT